MKVENDRLIFEYLTTASSSTVGDIQQVTAKIKSASSFSSSNAPGESANMELAQIEQLGRTTVSNFNRIFA